MNLITTPWISVSDEKAVTRVHLPLARLTEGHGENPIGGRRLSSPSNYTQAWSRF